jgi:hypothetical protein
MKIIASKKELIELLEDRKKSKEGLRDSYPKRSREYSFYKGIVEGISLVITWIKAWEPHDS